MTDAFETVISRLEEELRSAEEEVIRHKKTINDLCRLSGKPQRYRDADLEVSRGQAVRADEYYGKPLATAVRDVLEARHASNLGPATVNEIYESLKEGGFEFSAKSAENAKRGLRISLSKNTATFHKLPTGAYGLLDWYPAVREKRDNNGSEEPENGKEADGSEDQENEAGAAKEETS